MSHVYVSICVYIPTIIIKVKGGYSFESGGMGEALARIARRSRRFKGKIFALSPAHWCCCYLTILSQHQNSSFWSFPMWTEDQQFSKNHSGLWCQVGTAEASSSMYTEYLLSLKLSSLRQPWWTTSGNKANNCQRGTHEIRGPLYGKRNWIKTALQTTYQTEV